MRLSDFDFDLPPERIAQHPAARRDASRLLLLDRDTGRIEHAVFGDLTRVLRPGDLLVLNDTRVIAARMLARKASGGRVELLRVERLPGAADETWTCLLRASRDPAPGSTLDVGQGVTATVLRREGDLWVVRFETSGGPAADALERAGHVPLPPYVERPRGAGDDRASDRERYQTVYARRPGAVAAPTAGLHFTNELLEKLRGRGVRVAHLTLHVGPGTFQPIRTERVEDHRMHEEAFDLPEATAGEIARVRAGGGRVVAVGTTVVRTLEHRAEPGGTVRAGAGRCDLFIRPGFRFRVVDALLTNFHLPRSTLLLLVAAFAGREPLLAAYAEAIERGYRFYSYGDAMWVGDVPLLPTVRGFVGKSGMSP